MRYYVNKKEQDNGDHEVHTEICSWLPNSANQLYLGDYQNCVPAVAKAKQHYPQSNGCYYCSQACHTS